MGHCKTNGVFVIQERNEGKREKKALTGKEKIKKICGDRVTASPVPLFPPPYPGTPSALSHSQRSEKKEGRSLERLSPLKFVCFAFCEVMIRKLIPS